MFKNIWHLSQCVYNPPLVRVKSLGALASVKLGSCVLVYLQYLWAIYSVRALLCYAPRWQDSWGANMGPTWVLSASDGPHVGPMNLVIWVVFRKSRFTPILQDYFTDIEQAWRIRVNGPIWLEAMNISLYNHSKVISMFNSSPRNAAYIRQWIGSALVQIIAFRLFGAKPLPKPMLGYCQLDP